MGFVGAVLLGGGVGYACAVFALSGNWGMLALAIAIWGGWVNLLSRSA